jgi:uncharacterized membrane protein
MFLFTIEGFLHGYEYFIENIAHIVTYTLEMIGIVVIAVGAFSSIIKQCVNSVKKRESNIKIDLGNWLALGLEFKMGAEIIKTVVARDLQELAILGVIIGLRAVLALLIHWEIKTEMKEQELHQLKEEKETKEEK